MVRRLHVQQRPVSLCAIRSRRDSVTLRLTLPGAASPEGLPTRARRVPEAPESPLSHNTPISSQAHSDSLPLRPRPSFSAPVVDSGSSSRGARPPHERTRAHFPTPPPSLYCRGPQHPEPPRVGRGRVRFRGAVPFPPAPTRCSRPQRRLLPPRSPADARCRSVAITAGVLVRGEGALPLGVVGSDLALDFISAFLEQARRRGWRGREGGQRGRGRRQAGENVSGALGAEGTALQNASLARPLPGAGRAAFHRRLVRR